MSLNRCITDVSMLCHVVILSCIHATWNISLEPILLLGLLRKHTR